MIFPTMFLSLLAHLILRLFVGGVLLYLGIRHLKRDRNGLRTTLRGHWPQFGPLFAWYLGILEVILAIMFIAGAFTQIAALITAIISLKMLVFRNKFAHPAMPSPVFWILLLGISLSLFITGAGALAYDLPL